MTTTNHTTQSSVSNDVLPSLSHTNLVPPRFPPEIIHQIIDILHSQSEYPTLVNLLCCSINIYEYVTTLIYYRLHLKHSNARSIFKGLPEIPIRFIRGRRKTKPSITWSEFRHGNHYLDWAASVDWGHNENLRTRKFVQVWPDADIDSDDSDIGVDDLEGDSLMDDGVPYPNRKSFQRKEDLLDKVRILLIEEIPPKDVVARLDQWARRTPTGFSFNETSRISLGPKVIWALMDYNDRHHQLYHPFINFLLSLHPSHLCLQFPVPDSHLERSFMESRIVTIEEHSSRRTENDQHTFLRLYLRQLLRIWKFRGLRPLLCKFEWKPTTYSSVTFHGISTRNLPEMQSRSVRTFFIPCSCHDDRRLDDIDDHFCYDHFDTNLENDLRTLSDIPLDHNASLELINVEQICARDGCSCRTHEDLENKVEEKRMYDHILATCENEEERKFIREKIKFSSLEDAEPCVCCGEKELPGSKVRMF